VDSPTPLAEGWNAAPKQLVTTCFCEKFFHCLVKCYISIQIPNLAVGAKCGFFACQTRNFTRTKPSQEPHTQSLVTLILLTLGQALNSVPTARFTHFVHEPASSTSSELVGGCAPKPLLSHLAYVSIGINSSNIISLFFFFLNNSISFYTVNKYWNFQTQSLYQHYTTHTHIHTTTTKPQDILYFYSLPP